MMREKFQTRFSENFKSQNLEKNMRFLRDFSKITTSQYLISMTTSKNDSLYHFIWGVESTPHPQHSQTQRAIGNRVNIRITRRRVKNRNSIHVIFQLHLTFKFRFAVLASSTCVYVMLAMHLFMNFQTRSILGHSKYLWTFSCS